MEERIKQLEAKGVKIIDPRQTYIAEEVNLDRIYPGSILYPGTRLTGARTLIGTGAKIGTEGPATIDNSVIGAEAEVGSGFITKATLLSRASAGANSHYRAGTLLEEYASTAHCVGLKQSILMYAATCGSLINFCEVLMYGGRSRQEHSEVGSGFIHFNFTPWGKTGDKATASLIGNVVDGVFLDQEKIFLGGLSGMVGPNSVGFGAMTAAGQVVRKPVEDGMMYAGLGNRIDRQFSPHNIKFSDERLNRVRDANIEFIAQLYAFRSWYSEVRVKRSKLQENAELTLTLEGAIETIDNCIKERLKRYSSFAKQWGIKPINETALEGKPMHAGIKFSGDWKLDDEYDEWIWNLADSEKYELHSWLKETVENVKSIL